MARPAMSVHTISLTGTAATITLAQAGGERWPKQARQIKTSGPGPATAGESEARPAAAAAPRARAGGFLRRRLGLGMGLIITRIVALSGRVPNSRVSRIAAGGPPARNFAGELDAKTEHHPTLNLRASNEQNRRHRSHLPQRHASRPRVLLASSTVVALTARQAAPMGRGAHIGQPRSTVLPLSDLRLPHLHESRRSAVTVTRWRSKFASMLATLPAMPPWNLNQGE
jgi:hypothetical protein